MVLPDAALEFISFNCSVLVGVVALFLYYGDEHSPLHWGAMEHVFWFFAYAWLVFTLFLLPDSPLVQLRLFIRAGGADNVALIVLAGGMGVRSHWRRRSERMTSSLQRLSLADLVKLKAETLVARVTTTRLLEILSMSRSTVWFRGEGSKGKLVADALEKCRSSGPEHLLYVLNSGEIDLPHLFSVARTPEVLQILAAELPGMDVVTKLRLLDAVHRQHDFCLQRGLQDFAAAILQRTAGKELTALKNLIDEGGDFYNLHKLVFADLPRDLREAVLGHIAREGQRVREEPSVQLLRKVLSDIDDTLYSSGGHFPAGADRRLAKGQIYPGVLALLRELGRQQTAHGHRKHSLGDQVSPRTSASTPLGSGAAASLSSLRLSPAGRPADGARAQADPDEASGLPSSPGVSKDGDPARKDAISESLSQLLPTSSSVRRTLTEALFANLKQVRSRVDQKRHATSAVWLRVAADEWTEAAVPATETVEDLRRRLAAARQGSDLEGLDGHADVASSSPTVRPTSNLVFLSARPHAYKDYLESISYKLFRRLVTRGMLYCMPSLLAGRIRSSGAAAVYGAVLQFRTHLGVALLALLLGALAVCGSVWNPKVVLLSAVLGSYACLSVQASRRHQSAASVWRPVGEDKQGTFLEYQQLFNECDMVFFGDNGQGDLLCAERLAESPAAPVASFIHEVVPRGEQLTSLSVVLSAQGRERIWSERNICFFKTYVGAASAACERGLISFEGLARVARAAVEDLVRICTAEAKFGRHADCESLVQAMNADVDTVNEMLPESFPRVDLVPSSLISLGSEDFTAKLCLSPSMRDFAFLTQPPKPDHHG